MFAAYLFGRLDNQHAVFHIYFDLIAYAKLRIGKQILGKTHPLAIAPFLNFGMHIVLLFNVYPYEYTSKGIGQGRL